MDGRGQETGIEKLFKVFFFLACGAFSIAALLYFARFAPGSHGFSQNPADWAEFGEYLGGTLGGIFGLFAFIGVLITIVQQRNQLDLQREQSAHDDQQTQSRFYLDEYRAGYQTAFLILSSAAIGDPQMRVKWIAAARVLETARRISERITVPAHKDVLLMDLPFQAQRFGQFFEYPAMYYYGVREDELGLSIGEEHLNEAARAATRRDGSSASLRQIPDQAIQAVWFAVRYPEGYEDVLGGKFGDHDRLFLPVGLRDYLDHTHRWHSVAGNLIARTANTGAAR
jgi:hypothetical protein